MAKKKLGYTWYPKDFASDPDVMLMTAAERGIYRDLIDLAYQTNNCIKYSFDALARYTNGTAIEVKKVLQMKGKEDGDHWKIPSCDKRLKIIKRNSQNGKNNKKETEPVLESELLNKVEVQNEVGVFFRIGLRLYKYSVSKYVLDELSLTISQEIPKENTEALNKILKKFDADNAGATFTNHEHVRNSFKKLAREMMKEFAFKKDNDCPYTEEQLRIADSQKAAGMGTPEWFDKKYMHLLKN